MPSLCLTSYEDVQFLEALVTGGEDPRIRLKTARATIRLVDSGLVGVGHSRHFAGEDTHVWNPWYPYLRMAEWLVMA